METPLHRIENRIPELKMELVWLNEEIAEIEIELVLKDGQVDDRYYRNKIELLKEEIGLKRELAYLEKQREVLRICNLVLN